VYVVSRALQAIPTLAVAAMLLFTVTHLLPGNPALIYAGPDATPDVVAAVRRSMGLNDPLPVQFARWVERMGRGDFGKSVISGYTVADLLRQSVGPTVELAVAAMALSLAVGLALGIVAAIRRGAWLRAATAFSSLALTLPNFWTAILLILVFAVALRWAPPSGIAPLLPDPGRALAFLVLPALTLSFQLSGVICRFTQGTLLEVLREDYIRTARAKGLGQTGTVLQHALPNAMIPLVTVLGIEFGRLLGGVVIVEWIFAWPGLGRLTVQAINNRDYAVIQAALLLLTITVLGVNFAVDMLYGLIDPRIRYS